MTALPHNASNSTPTVSAVQTDHWIDPLKDCTHVLIRPLEAKDREREFAFIKNLSPESRHFRFLCSITEPGNALMNQLMAVNSPQQMAYVALFMDGGHLIEIGVARYASAEGDTQCESAVVVADQWQNKGLGKRLMQHLIDAARLNGFESMMSMDSAVNTHMRGLAQELGFDSHRDPLDATQVVYRLALN